MRSELAERRAYEALLDASTELVLSPDVPAALDHDASAWLARHGVTPDDAAQLVALGARRLTLYRRHVRRTLERAVRQEIPRTAARLGDAFEPWVERWIDDEGPRSHYFRDLAFELVAWARPRWTADPSLPPYVGDLAAHELVYFDVAASVATPRRGETEIALDRGVAFDGSVRLGRYRHAVHLLSEDLDARDVPEATPTALLAYRDADLDVRFLALTPLAAEIVERLIAKTPLGAAVSTACQALGVALDAAVTASTAALLEDLLQRGAVIGGEAC